MSASAVHAWALVPVKDFALAKARLAGVLPATARCALAEAMLRDVIAALKGAAAIDGISLVGGKDARRVAIEEDIDWVQELGANGLNAALNQAAAAMQQRGVQNLLVLPDDLPTLQGADVSALLARHRGGLSVSPARKDGGTNALVLSPPNAIEFSFGPDSARRHVEAGLAAGLKPSMVSLPAFDCDVDQPADLQWLHTAKPGQHTAAIIARLGSAVEPAAAQQ